MPADPPSGCWLTSKTEPRLQQPPRMNGQIRGPPPPLCRTASTERSRKDQQDRDSHGGC